MWEILIDGVDRTALLLANGFEITKDGGVETMTFVVFNEDVSTFAYSPAHGHTVRAAFDTDLEFGGVVQRLTRTRVKTRVGIKVECRGWAFDAGVRLTKTVAAGAHLLDLAHDLFTTYLQPRGWTWTGDTTGGPELPELTVEKQPLSGLYDELTQETGYPWRVNGDKVLSWTPAGSLSAPTALTESNATILKGHAIESTGTRAANRLFAQSGGTGTVAHSETHTGDGTRVCFPVNVEPSTPPTEVVETVSGTPTTYAIGGGRWNWDVDHVAAVKVSGGSLAPGDSVTVPLTVERPAWVRAWTAAAVASSGYFNWASVLDTSVQAGDRADVVQLVAWAQAELGRRLISRTIRLRTFTRGWYPWQKAAVTLPLDGVSGDWLVISTRLRVVGRGDQAPEMTLTLLEDGGSPRWWFDYFRERSGTTTGGISVGAGGVGSGGGSVGSGTLPIGHVIPLGGLNDDTFEATTSWQDWPNALPQRVGGPGMAGTWRLRAPMYQMAAGTLEARLFDVSAGAALATASTTATGTNAGREWPDPLPYADFSAPAGVDDILLQYRVTSGTRRVRLGMAGAVRIA